MYAMFLVLCAGGKNVNKLVDTGRYVIYINNIADELYTTKY